MIGVKLLSLMSVLTGLVIGTNYSEEYSRKGLEANTTTTAEAIDPHELYRNNCSACHGQNLEGMVGPSLTKVGFKYSKDEIANIIRDGKDMMPSGLVSNENEISVLADWLSQLKSEKAN